MANDVRMKIRSHSSIDVAWRALGLPSHLRTTCSRRSAVSSMSI